MTADQKDQQDLNPQDVQAAKMAAMGKLAAGVAHEINNPCGVLLMKLKFLLSIADEEQLSPRAISTLDVAVEQTERIQAIVDSLVRFSRPTQSMLRMVDVNEAIEGALTRTELPVSVLLQQRLSDQLPQVSADADQLQQVIIKVLRRCHADGWYVDGHQPASVNRGRRGDDSDPRHRRRNSR